MDGKIDAEEAKAMGEQDIGFEGDQDDNQQDADINFDDAPEKPQEPTELGAEELKEKDIFLSAGDV
jgi:hypothetical protein